MDGGLSFDNNEFRDELICKISSNNSTKFTCSNSTIETLEKCVKYVQS